MTDERPVEALLDLTGRVALVTGGTRNIGRCVAARLASLGASVAVFGNRDRTALDETVAFLGDTHGVPCVGLLADLGEPDSLSAALDDATASLGPVDVLVNNAAVRPKAELATLDVASWDAVQAVNLRAPFLLSRAVVPHMTEAGWGRIINVSGLDAQWGSRNRFHATTAKSALLGLTQTLALEVADHGVTVNAVVPGVIDTDRREEGTWYPELRAFNDRYRELIPMHRLGTPEEVANAVTFLASDMATYITGHTLYVTGGAFPMVRHPEFTEAPVR